MRMRVMVLEEVCRPFPRKNGTTGVEKGFSVRDLQETGRRLTNNLLYEYSETEESKYKGKLRDRIIHIEISELRAGFSGQISCKGEIVEIEGPDPAAPAAPSTRGSTAGLNADQKNSAVAK